VSDAWARTRRSLLTILEAAAADDADDDEM
jgi:hypothetical protein